MSAFSWRDGCPDPKPQKPIYIKSQANIYLNDADELLEAINLAKTLDSDTIWILNPGKGNGHTCISLWYAEALYGRIK